MSRAFARPGKLKPETQPAASPAWAKQQLFDSVVGLRLMALVLRTTVYSQACNKWKVRDSHIVTLVPRRRSAMLIRFVSLNR